MPALAIPARQQAALDRRARRAACPRGTAVSLMPQSGSGRAMLAAATIDGT
jgi:hypothetical protein